jgi:hypothetical protein
MPTPRNTKLKDNARSSLKLERNRGLKKRIRKIINPTNPELTNKVEMKSVDRIVPNPIPKIFSNIVMSSLKK